MLPSIFDKNNQQSALSARTTVRNNSRLLSLEKVNAANFLCEAAEVLRLAKVEAALIVENSRTVAHDERYANAVERVRKGEKATLVAQQTGFYRNTILADSKKEAVPLAFDKQINDDRFYNHAFLEDAVNRISVSNATGIPYTTLRRTFLRFDGCKLEELRSGRPAAVPPELLKNLKLSAAKRTLDGNSWERVHDYSNTASIKVPGFQASDCVNSFAHEFQEKHRQFQKIKHGEYAQSCVLKPLSISTVRKYEKQVCSSVVRTDTDEGGQKNVEHKPLLICTTSSA